MGFLHELLHFHSSHSSFVLLSLDLSLLCSVLYYWTDCIEFRPLLCSLLLQYFLVFYCFSFESRRIEDPELRSAVLWLLWLESVDPVTVQTRVKDWSRYVLMFEFES